MEKVEKKRKLSWKKLFQRVFLVLVVIFLVRYFYRNFDDIKTLDISFRWQYFIPSLLFYSIYKLRQATLWHEITVINDAAIPFPKAIYTFLYSILGKYIPGKVFMLLARIPAYKEEGVSADKVTVCFFLENCCTLLGASLLFVVSILFFPTEVLGDYRWSALILIVVFLVCIHPKVLNFFLGLLEKITKRSGMRIPMTYRQILRTVLLFAVNWIAYGIGFYLLVCSIHPIPVSQILFVSGLYALSCAAGIMAIFSPSGIGVREGILALGLGLIMDKNYAMIISIVARLWAVLVELVLIGIVVLVYHFLPRKEKTDGGEKEI